MRICRNAVLHGKHHLLVLGRSTNLAYIVINTKDDYEEQTGKLPHITIIKLTYHATLPSTTYNIHNHYLTAPEN